MFLWSNEVNKNTIISNVMVLTKIQPVPYNYKKETILRKKSTKNLFMVALSCDSKLVYLFAKLVYISACLVL